MNRHRMSHEILVVTPIILIYIHLWTEGEGRLALIYSIEDIVDYHDYTTLHGDYDNIT